MSRADRGRWAGRGTWTWASAWARASACAWPWCRARHAGARGFTLIELLVVIAILALLIGVLVPAIGGVRASARATACLSRLGQISTAVQAYLNDHDRTLPQVLVPVGGGPPVVIGALFGGKLGTLPAFGVNQYGAARRPLNRYLLDREPPADDEAGAREFEIEVYRSPADVGADLPGLGRVASLYNLVGSSYTLNDHSLEGDRSPTLVPVLGGRMPIVQSPARTWVVGSHPMYNFQENGDRGMRWYRTAGGAGGGGGSGAGSAGGVASNTAFLDGHVRTVSVPRGVVNTTAEYTFLP